MSMTKWQDFLLEHAKFPFPNTSESTCASSADLSRLDIGRLNEKWRAKYAMQDATLLNTLCEILEKILGDTPIRGTEDTLLSMFGRRLQFTPWVTSFGPKEIESFMWSRNRNKLEVQT